MLLFNSQIIVIHIVIVITIIIVVCAICQVTVALRRMNERS